jgi:hypothetical protein
MPSEKGETHPDQERLTQGRNESRFGKLQTAPQA